MVSIERMYGTKHEWSDLAKWIRNNAPILMSQLYKCPLHDGEDEIASFDASVDYFLLTHCNLEFVKNKIRMKHGLFKRSKRQSSPTDKLQQRLNKEINRQKR